MKLGNLIPPLAVNLLLWEVRALTFQVEEMTNLPSLHELLTPMSLEAQ